MISTNENIAGRQITLAQIETGCERYEKSSAILEHLIADLEVDLEAVKKKHLAAIKRQAAEVAQREAELTSLLETAGTSMFVKPKTLTIHGVKVGYTTSQGKLVFEDEATVIKLLKKYHKDDIDWLIRTIEEVNMDGVKTLSAEALERLGCRIEGAGEKVLCKRVSGEVEKLINKLISKLVEAMVETE